jgi:hypothetical protein
VIRAAWEDRTLHTRTRLFRPPPPHTRRPVLSFDAAFDGQPHLQLLKEMLAQVCCVMCAVCAVCGVCCDCDWLWAMSEHTAGARCCLLCLQCSLLGSCRRARDCPSLAAALSCRHIIAPGVWHARTSPQGEALLRPRAQLQRGGRLYLDAQLPGVVGGRGGGCASVVCVCVCV